MCIRDRGTATVGTGMGSMAGNVVEGVVTVATGVAGTVVVAVLPYAKQNASSLACSVAVGGRWVGALLQFE
eukprot:12498406-Ditylum_brightwellii.AAC.1